MNERAKSYFYTVRFWGGLACGGISAWLFGMAGTFSEYLVAFAMFVVTAFVMLWETRKQIVFAHVVPFVVVPIAFTFIDQMRIVGVKQRLLQSQADMDAILFVALGASLLAGVASLIAGIGPTGLSRPWSFLTRLAVSIGYFLGMGLVLGVITFVQSCVGFGCKLA